MKTSWLYGVRLSVLAICCLFGSVLTGCGDDDSNDRYSDPNFGYIKNSTDYTIAIDFGKDNEFSTRLAPGEMRGFDMDEGRSHLLHVVVLDSANRAVSEFFTNFNVDTTPFDNEWNGFVCSWYVDILRESGFGSEMGD
ncbi:hypothetical protein U14_02928 [Candidatus Moduliflexus flocculans]|uniref:Uncharacterized protein n=1 Tax=Candidatus Moduliflexus flocculans TaxID=1499966 RepID=A0A081BMR7_9BACT|nr:hypothetical protein U14_02928 [Candidatus Moduliflexus flocculans]